MYKKQNSQKERQRHGNGYENSREGAMGKGQGVFFFKGPDFTVYKKQNSQKERQRHGNYFASCTR